MLNLSSIVLTTDLSENSEAAAPYAVALAEKFGASIHLVHVFEEYLYSSVVVEGSLAFDPIKWVDDIESSSKKRLETMAAELSRVNGVQVIPHYLRGEPVAQLLNFVNANAIGCIVMATHGRTGFPHLVFGSVAEKVIRMSPCPVLTVKPVPVVIAHERLRSTAPWTQSEAAK